MKDNLKTAHGIINSIPISILLWAAIIFAAFALSGCTVSRDTAPMPPNAEDPLASGQSPGEKAMSKRFKAVLERPVQ